MNQKIAAVDFETYYDVKVSTKPLGVYAYCKHSQFDAYLVSIVNDQGSFVGHPSEAPWHNIEDHLWVSHNAGFDRCVFKHVTGRDHSNWQCTANMSAFLHAGRSLAKAAKHLLGIQVSKDVRELMRGLKPGDMKLRPSSTPGEFENFYEEVRAYALIDSEVCLRLYLEHSHKWPQFEKDLSLHTIEMCLRGFPIDEDKIEQSLKTLNQEVFDASNRLPWVRSGGKALSRKSFFAACREANIEPPKSLAKDKPDYQEWCEKYSDKFSWAKDRRLINSATIITPRLDRMRENSFEAGDHRRMSYSLLYYGTHTGRWSGSEGFNVQNLNKDEVCGVYVRHHIAAKAPRKLIISDLAQIEARITPYLAGDMDTIELVSKGISVYEAHARVTMGWTGGKLKDEDPKKYSLAKTRVLALGFGCGAVRFKDTAKKMLGMDISISEAKSIVNEYRRQNPKIVGMWDNFGELFRNAVRKKEDVTVELPSGRSLLYFKPEIHKDVVADKVGIKVKFDAHSETAMWIHGPLAFENCLGADTRVFTLSGTKRIVDVTKDDLVWDGHNWVTTYGVAFRGVNYVTNFDGVSITFDHKIHDGEKWIVTGESTIGELRNCVEFGGELASRRNSDMGFGPVFTWPKKSEKYDDMRMPIFQEQAETFDLLNCGPNSRFMIETDSGALLVHNCVQATARDVFGESILRLERNGYPVLFHVHDEAIVETDAKGSAKEVEEIMSVTPDWLPGCPIGAEAVESQFYLK